VKQYEEVETEREIFKTEVERSNLWWMFKIFSHLGSSLKKWIPQIEQQTRWFNIVSIILYPVKR
jgi:hypothetical protein